MPTEPQSQPLVSIIVPVYNAADHIARCIESIRRQTYRNLEIILLNDGSKDVSYAVCQSYAGIDRRIVVIDKNNSGVSATGGAHLCSIQYYLRFWLGICRTSLAVSALRIMRYCPKAYRGENTK